MAKCVDVWCDDDDGREAVGHLTCRLSFKDRNPGQPPRQRSNIGVCTKSSFKFTHIKQITSDGQKVLVTADGHAFLWGCHGSAVHWHCEKRMPPTLCRARMYEVLGEFIPSEEMHNHEANINDVKEENIMSGSEEQDCISDSGDAQKRSCVSNAADTRMTRAKKRIKRLAIENPFGLSSKIVNEALGKKKLREYAKKNRSRSCLLKYCREVQDRARSRDKFFRKRIVVRKKPHMIFASDEQLRLLAMSKTWYIDINAMGVESFTHIMSIHSFAKGDRDDDEILCHPPLVFVLMSRKSMKRDYAKVLRAILALLPFKHKVSELVADFKKALWEALRLIFYTPSIRGCFWQWNRALDLKAHAAGQPGDAVQRRDIPKNLKLLFALPLLPAEHIPLAFSKLHHKLKDTESLKPLLEHVRDTFVENPERQPSSWSAFGRAVRLWDDVREWQGSLNRLNKNKDLSLPVLLSALQGESEKIYSSTKPVSGEKLLEHRRGASRVAQMKLDEAWKLFSSASLTPWQLLKSCTKLCDLFLPS